MLTDEKDVVLDIFGGSNTTGYAAEALRRKWLTFELNKEYLSSSVFRFLDGYDSNEIKEIMIEMQGEESNYPLGNIRCILKPVNTVKKRKRNHQASLFHSEDDSKTTNNEETTQ
jgi:site-specific DNA-methyltransferase (cytosine-N4-specific)